MKRLLAIILSLAMLLSACSSQGNDSNKTQESTESEPVVTESENVQNNAESVSTQEAGNDTNVKKDDGLDFTVKGLDKFLNITNSSLDVADLKVIKDGEIYLDGTDATDATKITVNSTLSNFSFFKANANNS